MGADTAVEVAILLSAKDAASGVISGVTSKFAGLGSAAKIAVAGVAALATAGVAVIGTLTALAVKSAAAAGEVSKLKRETGLTTEAASKFRAIGERLGLSVDDLSKSFGTFSKSVDNNAMAIADNHIAVVRNKDGQVNFEATLAKVADRFKGMPDGVEKTSLAMELFGKTGKDMIPLLNKGSDGLKDMGDQAARLGLVLDDKALAAAKRFSLSQKDMAENIEGLKNKLGMAFLPILADVSGALLSFANAALPTVTAALDRFSGFVTAAAKTAGELWGVFTRKNPEAGGFLASIIGKETAAEFMGLVASVGNAWKLAWDTKILPAIQWAQENVPVFWGMFKTAVSNAWTIIEPKIEAFVEKLEKLKAKFESLPPTVQKWAEVTALGVVAVKVTGLDGIIQGWANALGNFVGGGAGAVAALTALGIAVGTALIAFGLLALAIGAVIFIGTHLTELEDSWTMLSQLFKLEFAKVGDFLINIWRLILKTFENGVNTGILIINGLISALNLIPGVNIPLISKIHIDLPDANNVEQTLANIARDRTSHIAVQYTGGNGNIGFSENASGTDHITHGPELLLAGEAGPEHVSITPLGRRGSGSGGGPTINITINGDVVGLSKTELADAIGNIFYKRMNLAGRLA